MMKNKILFTLLSILLISSCSTVKHIPVKTETIYTYKDSTIVHIDTIEVKIPVEVHNIVTFADSSHLETSVATSDAWVDSLSILHHRLENKAENALKKEVVYKDRIVYRDSIVTKDVPVPYEVVKTVTPKWAWYSLVINIFETLLLALFIYFLFFKRFP